jgi:two-component SAPR family response regulator
MNCLAVDDEPFALKLLADDIQKVPFLKLIKTYTSPLDALEYLKHNSIDLFFSIFKCDIKRDRIVEDDPTSSACHNDHCL